MGFFRGVLYFYKSTSVECRNKPLIRNYEVPIIDQTIRIMIKKRTSEHRIIKQINQSKVETTSAIII